MTEVAEDLAGEPGSERKRKDLLEKALQFYDELRKVERDDADLEWLAARAARRVGDIQRQLGRHAEAREAYASALDRLAPLAVLADRRDEALREQAECHNWLGEIARTRSELAAAVESYRRALAIQLALHAGDPDYPGYRQDLSRTYYNLGIVARHTNRLADARLELGEATRLLSGLSETDPKLRHHRARIYLNLGPVYRLSKELPEADTACAEAVRLLESLAAEFKHKVEYRFELSAALINQGLVQRDRDDLGRATSTVGRARDLLDRLASDYPITPKYKAELAKAFNSLAAIADKARDRTAATGHLARAKDVLADLTHRYPDNPEYHGELGIALGNLGRTLDPSRPEEARKHLADGLREVAVALRANPDERYFRHSFRQQSGDLARLLVRAGDHEAARKQATDLAQTGPPVGTRLAVCFLAACVDAVRQSGSAADEVERYAQHAIALVRAHPPSDPAALLQDPDCEPLRGHAGLAEALRTPACGPKD
jgi:tetratricopeptide (TPR) repeat protein